MNLLSCLTVFLILALPSLTECAEFAGKVSSEKGEGLANTLVYVVSDPVGDSAWPDRGVPKWVIRGGRLDSQAIVVQTGKSFSIVNPMSTAYNVQVHFKK